MSLVKKIAFLIVVFIGFVIFSVYNFDYESPLNNQISTTQNGQINSSDTGLIDKIIDKFVSSDKNGSEPFSMVISKKDGMIVLQTYKGFGRPHDVALKQAQVDQVEHGIYDKGKVS